MDIKPIGTERQVRPVLLLALGLALAAGIVVPTGLRLYDRHEDEVTGRLKAVAERVNDPAGARQLELGQCPDQTFLVRCLLVATEPDELAARYRTELSSVAGSSAASTCSDLPAGWNGMPLDATRLRSCLVRIDQGRHAVLISIDSETRRVRDPDSAASHSGTGIIAGSRVRIEST